MPKLLPTLAVTLLALTLGAAPALGRADAKYRHVKTGGDYEYTATIDCGPGPRTVVSGEDLYAPLVDLDHHRFYAPIAWDVQVNGDTVVKDERKVTKPAKRLARDCSYSDGVATGTVTVLGPFPGPPS